MPIGMNVSPIDECGKSSCHPTILFSAMNCCALFWQDVDQVL